MNDKKYLINVDFPEISRIHLNPELFNIDPRCRTGPKNPEDGGVVTVTEEEATRYLRNGASLFYDGKQVTNLKRCQLCSNSPEYNLP